MAIQPSYIANAPLARQNTIRWVNGMPVPVNSTIPQITKDGLNAVPMAALASPYMGLYDPEMGEYVVEPEFVGMSNVEVANLRLANMAACGSIEAYKVLHDRAFGKAKQQIESIGLKMTYEEYLEHLVAKESQTDSQNANTITPNTVIDIEINPQPETAFLAALADADENDDEQDYDW